MCKTGTTSIWFDDIAGYDPSLRAHRLDVLLYDAAGNIDRKSTLISIERLENVAAASIVWIDELVLLPAFDPILTQLANARAFVAQAQAYLGFADWDPGTAGNQAYRFGGGARLLAQRAVQELNGAIPSLAGLPTEQRWVEDMGMELARAALGDCRMSIERYSTDADLLATDETEYITDAQARVATADAHMDTNNEVNLATVGKRVCDDLVLLGEAQATDEAFRDAWASVHNDAEDEDLNLTNSTAHLGAEAVRGGAGYVGRLTTWFANISANAASMTYRTDNEIRVVHGLPATPAKPQLASTRTYITDIKSCGDRLATLDLNDRELADCYMELANAASTMDTIQGALVDTKEWKATMALILYGLLETTLWLSPTSVDAIIRGWQGRDPNIDPVGDGFVTGRVFFYANYDLLTGGDVDTAFANFIANKCQIITYYNKYYSSDSPTLSGIPAGSNVSAPLEASILPSDYGC
jgi:hypothetical protein